MKSHHFYGYVAAMNLIEIRELVESTGDPAFAVDDCGMIVAWNNPVVELTGISKESAIGKACLDIIHAESECGPVCSENCTVRQAVQRQRPIKNFDIRISTPEGKRWCNVSVMAVKKGSNVYPYALHILRQIDIQKKLELTMVDFVTGQTRLAPEVAKSLMNSSRSPASAVDLTAREVQILKLLATGAKTAIIAKQLHITRATLNNHIQHVLRKLNCHTRLEAIRHAEHAGLI